MFIHEQDRSWVTPCLELVEAWLEENEQDYAGHVADSDRVEEGI
jgi:hypothetical protein